MTLSDQICNGSCVVRGTLWNMSDFKTFQLEQTAGVATLKLTGKMGTLAPAFWQELPSGLQELADARALILRGDQAFSAGIDLPATLEALAAAVGHPKLFAEFVMPMQNAIEALAQLPIPVVAAVHDWCIGAGLELACAADIRLCTKEAQFSLPEVKLGLVADLGGLQRLPHIIGVGRTAHLAFTADSINADTAEQWGLVTQVCSSEEMLYQRATEIAHTLAQRSPQAMSGTKKALNTPLDHQAGLEFCQEWNGKHLNAEDLQRGIKMFKRN